MAYRQILSELFPRKPAFSLDDFPSLDGRVALVTGGNTGIGKSTCRELLRKNAKVYMACRSKDKAEAVIKELKQETGRQTVYFIPLDLGDLSTIKNTVGIFTSREQRLDLLFANAGVMNPPKGSKTVQGHELQMGTNVLGHFLLTKLLMPTLLATAEARASESRERGYHTVRVIVTSSNAHLFAPKGGINFDDPNLAFSDPRASYGQSKIGNVLLSKGLAQRYGDRGITSHSLNPGIIKTELTRHMSSTERSMVRFIQHPVSLGQLTQLYAALAPEAGRSELNGSYYIPWGRRGVVRNDANDSRLIDRFWNWMEEQVEPFV